MVDQRWLITSSGTATDRFQYGYDRDSNALYRNNLVNTAFGELYHASGAGNGYDNLNQLSGFLRGVLSASGGSGTPLDTISSPSTTESWSPDAMGNFSSITTNGSTQTRTHNQQNEVSSISGLTTPTYDTNGNLTTDELGQTYKYNAWNRLVQVKNSVGTIIASHAYHGLGRRIQETHGSTVNDLYYSAAWQVLEERTGGVSTATVQYVWSPVYIDALVLRDRSTQNNGTLDERLWVQQDANWNVTALVNSSGSVVERYDNDPYGQVTYLNASFGTLSASAYAWIYLHQGGRLDTATGNYNFRERDLRPTMQRWVEPDPTGIGGGDTNFYRAEGDNPTNLIDPTGLAGIVANPGGAWTMKDGKWVPFERGPQDVPPPKFSGWAATGGAVEGALNGGGTGILVGLLVSCGNPAAGIMAGAYGAVNGAWEGFEAGMNEEDFFAGADAASGTGYRTGLNGGIVLGGAVGPPKGAPAPKPQAGPGKGGPAEPPGAEPVAPEGVPPLRQAYFREVEALKDTGAKMRAAGKTPEEIARTMSQMRREIGIKYKDLTPPEKLAEIYERNQTLYGDKLGPTVEWLREQGYTWEEIIDKASRPGGADLGLGKPE